MEVMATVRQEPVVAKKVYLHRNGLKGLQPKMIVVNERHIRDFSSFLNRVTSGIKAPVAVRSIYTPVGGRRINRLEDLQNGKHYVAGGNEQFKKLRYSKHSNSLQKPLLNKSLENKIHLPVRTVQAVSRFRNLPEKPYLIHVFRNGDALFKGVKVLLPRRLMNSWEHILEIVTDKADLTLPAKKLCTLEGNIIHSVTDIRDGEKYVALEGARRFIKLPYTSIEPSPKQSNKRHIRMRRLTSTLTSTDTSTLQTTIQSTDDQPKIKRLMPIKQHKGVERPFAGHKNKAARNRALRYAQTDSAFGQTTTVPGVVQQQQQEPNTSIISEGGGDTTITTTTTIEDMGEDNLDKSITIENEVDVPVISGTVPVKADSSRPNSNDGHKLTDEDVVAEEIPPIGSQENEEAALTINGDGGGITELQGQNPNENVDLSVARKAAKQEDKEPKEQNKDGVHTPTASVHSLPKPISQQSSKLQSKSNTPLAAASKSSLRSKRSLKNESRTSSKHSVHSSNHEPPPPPAEPEGTPPTQENEDEVTSD